MANSGGEFPRSWLPWLPAYVQIGDEVVKVGAVTATSFTGVQRGYFGTAPMSNSLSFGVGIAHDTGVAITPYIHYDHADKFLISKIKYELMFVRMQDAEGEANRNIAVMAAEYGRQAEDAKRNYNPEKTPRVMTMRFTPRR